MSVVITFAGESFTIPTSGEKDWPEAVTDFFQAIADNGLSNPLTLSAELDLGATYGIRAPWFRSETTNPATAGVGRLARADKVSWRNQLNNANLDLGPGSDNVLEFNSVDIVTVSATQTLTNKTLTSPAIATPVVAWDVTDISGTPGAGTVNAYTGKFAFAAGTGAAGITITNSKVASTSGITATVITNDGTCKSAACVPGTGSFVAYANANATGVTKVFFAVFNP